MGKIGLVVCQCHICEWASMIQKCNNRLDGMTISEWCNNHSITKANYYRMMHIKRKRKTSR